MVSGNLIEEEPGMEDLEGKNLEGKNLEGKNLEGKNLEGKNLERPPVGDLSRRRSAPSPADQMSYL